jgi:hypothetical protein
VNSKSTDFFQIYEGNSTNGKLPSGSHSSWFLSDVGSYTQPEGNGETEMDMDLEDEVSFSRSFKTSRSVVFNELKTYIRLCCG